MEGLFQRVKDPGTKQAVMRLEQMVEALQKSSSAPASLTGYVSSDGTGFTDTTHGNRGGGALHIAATTSSPGFMSATDKAKLDRASIEYSVKAYGAVGDGTTDDTTAIQAAIDAANTAATSSQTRTIYSVVIPEGDYKITAQIVVKAHVSLRCEGMLHNYLTDVFAFAIWFKAGSHCEKIQLYGHLQGGVQFGEASTYCDMQIGDVRLLNIGETYTDGTHYHRGVLFTGYNFTADSIDIDGGNVGLDISTASDVRIDKVLAYTGSTGVRITSASEHVWIGYLDIDTPSYVGLQIDTARDVFLPNTVVFINDDVGTGALSSGYAINIGAYSSGDKVQNLNLTARIQNTGGTGVKLSYAKSSTIDLHINNDAPYTGGATPISTGLEYGSGVESSVNVTGTITTTTMFSGTPAGGCLVMNGSGEFFNRGVDPAGAIQMYGGATAPSGWLLCDGAAVSRTTYAALYAVLTTTYGAGDSSTTFNLPDLRGRVPVGVDGAAGRLSGSDALGNTGGTETHTLTATEMPSHDHSTVSDGYGVALATLTMTAGSDHAYFSGVTNKKTGASGSGGAHNNMQPYQVVNYIIKT